MDSLIPIFNKIQDVFTITGNSGKDIIHLPQIIVVGSQSSGKSSVLESLVGRSFLPRGSGVVTRCPIVLQLIHVIDDDVDYQEQKAQGIDEWVVFLHSPTKVYRNFDDVREEIENETARIAGTNKGISTSAISLKIYSKEVLNLTLVDLPGLVKVPSGDQPEDIEDKINDLVLKYISNPNSIILAVSPANYDIATSASLKLAKSVDPNGLRTLAVLTKLDLMDSGTNAMNILSGKALPVKLGIVGVVNRSQQDTMDNKTISDGIKAEADFLKTNYPVKMVTNGIPYLIKLLNRILMDRIVTCLPSLEAKIHSLMKQSQNILKMLKADCVDAGYKMNELLSEILIRFNNAYCANIDGRSRHITTEKLTGGVLVDFAFKEIFYSDMDDVEAIQDVTDTDILVAIRNSKGIESNLFVPEDAFHELVKRQILRLKKPALDCAANIDMSLKKIIDDCLLLPDIRPYMERFPFLSSTIASFVRDFISKRFTVAEEILTNYVNVKASFIQTAQKEFRDKIADMKDIDVLETRLGNNQMLGDHAQGASKKPFSTNLHEYKEKFVLNENQQKQCEIVRTLMDSYFSVIKNDCMDYVPQALVHSMIYYLSDNLQQFLISNLCVPEKMEKLMQESESIANQRKSAENMLKTLEKATGLIADIQETNF